MLGPMLRVLIVALVLLVAAMLALPRAFPPPPPPENATLLPSTLPLPEFSLQDANGEPFTNASLGGGFRLMFFGFTNCPDVCPITLGVLASAVQQIEREAPNAVPEVVFVSVDPFRDTPERIRAYLAGFDASFKGVTGADDALEPLLQALGIGVQKHEHHGEQYNVVHSGVVFVIGPNAQLVAVSSAPHVPATLATDFLRIRSGYLHRARGGRLQDGAG
jgi:protein SCO1